MKEEEKNAVRENKECPDGYEHQMPDGSWMCGKEHDGDAYDEFDENQVDLMDLIKRDGRVS